MLPKEMLILILKKLSFKNIKNVLLVCRYWRTLGEDPVLWKKFQFLFIKNPAFLVEILSSPRLSKVEHITLDGLYEFKAGYDDSHMNFLLDMKLKHLQIEDIADMRDVSADILAKVVNKCEIVELGSNLSEEQYYEIFYEMSKETKLKKFLMPDNIFVRNIPADILARALNNIEDVTLSNLTRFQILSMFLSMSLTTSKTVHLNLYANNLNHLPNHILVSAVSKLKSLTLGPLDQDKVTSIMTSLRKGTNLSYLDFGDSDVTDVHPEVLAKGLVSVETVNLMCTRLYTNQITELCKEMAKEDIALKHLHLQHDLRDVPSDIL